MICFLRFLKVMVVNLNIHLMVFFADLKGQFVLYCSTRMNYNGYNVYTKQGLGCVKIGRYVCPVCNGSFEEERGFWESLKNEFFTVLDRLFQVLRVNHVSFRGIF